MQLPSPAPASSSTSPPVSTYQQAQLSTYLNRLVAVFPPVGDGPMWVNWLIIGSTPALTPTGGNIATVHIGQPPTARDAGSVTQDNIYDLTHRGDGDRADYWRPLYVPANASVMVAWNFGSGVAWARLERAA